MSRSSNRSVGITLGDPAGIGAEVTAKALAAPSLRRAARFTIIGDECLFRKYFPVRYKNCAFIDVGCLRAGNFTTGRPSRLTGKASLAYLQTAIDLIKSRQLSALVTAPVCKEAVGKTDASFHGHTEFLAGAFHARDIGMMFVSGPLRVLLVTRHIPLAQVSKAVNAGVVLRAIRAADDALKIYFLFKSPLIGVCGLNPHAGEGGTLGREEIRHIIPAVKRARAEGVRAEGPFPADTVFYPRNSKRFDVLLAMYHDQGLVPVKALYFRKLVNLTVGLPFVRTSPAHGTAFDIAGKDKADASSMAAAVKLAVHLAGGRA
ncbi:MAG: 4-hydroxythreonine-4-phosphate dehydrogenase PdxA [Candidatus Omnitrophica bacterium]|nr:4-hydroxythreonine-4-phosphate dehydrogenase PdxA [Candidatus Omnitrophota bacterium]